MAGGGEEDFWAFSLDLYGWEGVAQAALRLQDEFGKDVNLALCCLYAGLALGVQLDAAQLVQLETAVADWNDAAVRPLRAVRRRLKSFVADPAAASLRRRVQAAELDAERLAQRRLAALLPPPVTDRVGSLDLARHNLLLYAGDAAHPLVAAVRDGLG